MLSRKKIFVFHGSERGNGLFFRGKCRDCKEVRVISDKLVAIEIVIKNVILYYTQNCKMPEDVDFLKIVSNGLRGFGKVKV